ncbi:MAG: DUF2182 domain-containing protein [Pseudomonadota bacterium]
MSSAADLTGKVLRHERAIVAIGIALLAGLCWWYLAAGAGMEVEAMPHMAAQPPLGALITMWWLMMLAMMLPSAAPAILLYAQVRRQRGRESVVQPWIFAAGYALVWLAFSLAAGAIQSRVTFADPRLASVLLIAAGAYQLSPLKNACLRQCQSPARFLSRHWRPGVGGALRLGALHGAYCVGCCWMLMALLFVGGVMNFAWIAALTLIVGVEKLVPRGEWIGRAAGIALIGWGAFRLLS